jgi:hypothetical protein
MESIILGGLMGLFYSFIEGNKEIPNETTNEIIVEEKKEEKDKKAYGSTSQSTNEIEVEEVGQQK